MIDFETPESIQQQVGILKLVAENMLRPISREYDEREHDKPMELFNFMWENLRAQNAAGYERNRRRANGAQPKDEHKPKRPSLGSMTLIHVIEQMAWGDVGLYLSVPGSGLGGAAIEAAGTPEQKERFLKRFSE